MAFDPREWSDGVESGSRAGFGPDSGRAEVTYTVLYADLEDTLRGLVGGHIARGDGTINRLLPAHHPQWPWLFCERVSEVVGIGKQTSTNSAGAAAGYGVSPISYYPIYAQYRVRAEFTPRPYSVLPDSWISTGADAEVTDDPPTTSALVRTATEYLRFFDVEYLPADEYITAQQGQMAFYTAGGGAPEGFTFAGMPRIRIPAGTLKATWYFVPYRYVTSTSSLIVSKMGRVNQTAFLGYAAGKLLYDSVMIQRFTPAFPGIVPGDGGAVPSAEKLCHVTFLWKLTDRTPPSVPAVPTDSWIPRHHNAQPWFGDYQFYYAAVADPNLARRRPMYRSCLFQRLFADPDVP